MPKTRLIQMYTIRKAPAECKKDTLQGSEDIDEHKFRF